MRLRGGLADSFSPRSVTFKNPDPPEEPKRGFRLVCDVVVEVVKARHVRCLVAGWVYQRRLDRDDSKDRLDNADKMDVKLNAIRDVRKFGVGYKNYLERTPPADPPASGNRVARRWHKARESLSRAPVPILLPAKYQGRRRSRESEAKL